MSKPNRVQSFPLSMAVLCVEDHRRIFLFYDRVRNKKVSLIKNIVFCILMNHQRKEKYDDCKS